MDAIFNAQVGMAFGIIVILLVVYVVVVGWVRRAGDRTTDPKAGPSQAGQTGQGDEGAPILRAGTQNTAAAGGGGRKKKQFQIQGKDAEIAASVLRRMLSNHDKS